MAFSQLKTLTAALAVSIAAAPAFATEADIVDTAVAAGTFQTLVAAVGAAGRHDAERIVVAPGVVFAGKEYRDGQRAVPFGNGCRIGDVAVNLVPGVR